MSLILHGYFRSTASWRVRIALGLKGLAYENVFHHLRRGDQRKPDFLAINPQGLVPALQLDDGQILTQSLAICGYLDSVQPQPPLLPEDPVLRAQVSAFAQVIACDTHPIQNLKVLGKLRALGLSEEAVAEWARDIIDEGLQACDALLARTPAHPFCFGDQPTLADLCLVPQLGNARRFGVDLKWSRLLEIEAHCNALPAFVDATPGRQSDAE